MKNLKNKSRVFYNLLLLLIFLLAFFLRVFYLQDNALTFGYDQARDALITQQILDNNIKIQGPPSSQPGLYHGVLYYYFLSPAYLVGGGSPLFSAYYLAFFNSLAVILVFLIARIATKNNKLALLSSLFYAVSFESSQYATWLSNPTIAIFFVPLMYLGLWLWINKKWIYAPILTAIGLGLSAQSEIFLIYHLIPLLIWLYVYRKNIDRKSVYMFLLFFVISISTLILCEIKFGFKSVYAFKSLAASGDGNLAYVKSLGDYLVLYLNQLGRVFAFNTYPGNIGYGGAAVVMLGIYSLIKNKKDIYPAFLATWLFSHISVVTVGGTTTPFLMVGIGPAVSLILGYYIYKLFNKKVLFALVITCIILLGNVTFILSQNKSGSTLFSIQKDMVLSKQFQAIDYTYHVANGNPFSINSVTSPLWINIVWTYLYNFNY